jgi:hypothetical protein
MTLAFLQVATEVGLAHLLDKFSPYFAKRITRKQRSLISFGVIVFCFATTIAIVARYWRLLLQT